MKTCPYCGYSNREGLLFCEECGQGLTESIFSPTLPTRQVDDQMSDFVGKSSWGSSNLATASSLTMHIRDAADPVSIPLTNRLILGRDDSSNPQQPDIDLTPYGALEKGVSRLHAAIERNDDVLILVDLNSSNGTYLNNQRLVTEQPRILRDGDEIRLGKLVAHVYFK